MLMLNRQLGYLARRKQLVVPIRRQWEGWAVLVLLSSLTGVFAAPEQTLDSAGTSLVPQFVEIIPATPVKVGANERDGKACGL